MAERHLLVVEGADCMGKSTLIEQLRKPLGWPVTHTGGPKTEEQLEEVLKSLEGYTERSLIDRVPHLSEIAYRPLSRDPVPGDLQAELIRRFVALNPVLIVCRLQELPTLVPEARAHKPLEYWERVIKGYPGIVARYDDLIERLAGQVPIYVYDWTAPNAQAQLQSWVNWMFFEENE